MRTEGIERARQAIQTAMAPRIGIGLREAAMQRIVNELGYANRPIESANYASLMQMIFPETRH